MKVRIHKARTARNPNMTNTTVAQRGHGDNVNSSVNVMLDLVQISVCIFLEIV